MQQVKLTNEKTDTIHLDDVDYQKGISAKDMSHPGVGLVFKDKDGFFIRWTCSNGVSIKFNCIRDLFTLNNVGYYYIPTGHRIVLEKELTVDDLTDADNIGFVDYKGYKGYIACVDDNRDLRPLWGHGTSMVCNCHAGKNYKSGIGAAIELAGSLKELYKFPTRKDLYTWLAE